ncbi:uncharacterized protein [Palaemon carinicauda]|uniref:uncharacterized protein n=1 Tax=Palaemon carinicauda TaxID=392227 RepID=UPI0035B60AA3
MPTNRSHIPSPDMVNDWPHLHCIREKLVPVKTDCDIGLLIGYNCAKALVPLEVIPPSGNGPYAQRSILDWTIVGSISTEFESDDSNLGASHVVLVSENLDPLPVPMVQFTLRCKIKEVSPSDVAKILEKDFTEFETDDVKLSTEDRHFLKILEDNLSLSESGQFVMPLLFRRDDPSFSYSMANAMRRLRFLVKRLEREKTLYDHYISFMNDMLERGYAEVPQSEIVSDHCFYIPHHGVYNFKKPGKIRVVFDCSARCNGVSINDELLQGPDLMNNLSGVLCRFRKEPIAISCDVEKMFCQFKVKQEHRDYLRFLWYDKGDFSSELKHFRMTVHLFGAVSSPGCANFGMKKAADDGEPQFGKRAAEFVRKDFYVDDGLTSVSTPSDAVELVRNTQRLCAHRGIRLYKFCSNSTEVLQSIPIKDRCQIFQSLYFNKSDNLVERTLGVEWSFLADCFQFKVLLKEKPLSGRGILSTISSVFDPLGFVSPFILQGKQILQELCRDNNDWDSPLSNSVDSKWLEWKTEILHLHDVKMNRCIKPLDFSEVVSVEFHHFSDASTLGYGQCSCVRLFYILGRVHVSLVFSKSRVAPLKQILVPRLELTAAVLSVRVSSFLNKEFNYSGVKNFYYTDSRVVLGYIGNEAKRFHVFVANRVQQIKNLSSTHEWVFVSSDENPADIASRGASVQRQDVRWFSGPSFLWEPDFVPKSWCINKNCVLSSDDPEVKKNVSALSTSVQTQNLDLQGEFMRFSSWLRLKKAVALCLKFVRSLKNKVSRGKIPLYKSVTAEDIQEAEIKILQSTQDHFFHSELDQLKEKISIGQSSKLHHFNCFLDGNGLLRLGGRLSHGYLSYEEKFPVVLPKISHITSLVIGYCHSKVAHQGKGFTLNEIRSQGYWIMNASSAVASFIFKCVVCRRNRGKLLDQKMSDLPDDRVNPSPCFSFCACDFFGPFIVKQGRKAVKRHGVLFVYMYSRAVHLEVADSLSTDSFINAQDGLYLFVGQLRCLGVIMLQILLVQRMSLKVVKSVNFY